MTDKGKRGREAWLVIQKLQEIMLLTPSGELACYEIYPRPEILHYPAPLDQVAIMIDLAHQDAIKLVKKYIFSNLPNSVYEEIYSTEGHGKVKAFHFEEGSRFQEVSEEYSKYSLTETNSPKESYLYVVSIRNEKIWINDYLLSKPRSTGKNMLFFESVFEKPGVLVTPDKLPDQVRRKIGSKDFIKMIDELGFKGVILDAFFPKRSKYSVQFRKGITRDELEKNKIDIESLEQNLQKSDLRNTLK